MVTQVLPKLRQEERRRTTEEEFDAATDLAMGIQNVDKKNCEDLPQFGYEFC